MIRPLFQPVSDMAPQLEFYRAGGRTAWISGPLREVVPGTYTSGIPVPKDPAYARDRHARHRPRRTTGRQSETFERHRRRRLEDVRRTVRPDADLLRAGSPRPCG